MYDRVTDRSRGFAFVKMGSVEEAKEAIRMYDGSVSVHILFTLPSINSLRKFYNVEKGK